MLKYILKRLGIMIVTLWFIATLTFVLINALPGDPIGAKAKKLPAATEQAIRAKYGLDKPASVRYVNYLET